MGETDNIAKMAEKIAREIFEEFGWERVGPINQNWTCVKHNKHNKKQHPSDVVFRYPNPYKDEYVYINMDLKSYANKSISKAGVSGAIKNLIKSVECANTSEDWQELYVYSQAQFDVRGMLFIYNHDNEYDPEKFTELLLSVDQKNLALEEEDLVFVWGSGRISFLASIAMDLALLRHRKKIGDLLAYYPDMVLNRPRTPLARSVTAETLSSNLITFSSNQSKKVVIYYNGTANNSEEFEHIIEYLFNYQLIIDPETVVEIRTFDGSPRASVNLERAKDVKFDEMGKLPEFKKRFSQITHSSVSKIIHQYSEIEIGLQDG